MFSSLWRIFNILSLLLVQQSSPNEDTLPLPVPVLQWKSINLTLPTNTSHQVLGYLSEHDRVYLLGGMNMHDVYYTLQFNESYQGWQQHEKLRFEALDIVEYQQSYFSSKHNFIYIQTGEYIHVYDMELYYFNLNVIRLPSPLLNGCLTVYYDPDDDDDIEYLIVIGSTARDETLRTTWIFKVNDKAHNITFHKYGPDLLGARENFCCAVMSQHLYVIGGVYDDQTTRFIEQWSIADMSNVDEQEEEGSAFRNIETLINADIAQTHLPQFGHRCVVNADKQHLYVIGGVTQAQSAQLVFNYSRYILIMQRVNDTLHELNYERQTLQQHEKGVVLPQILPSLPTPSAYAAIMLDRYGYLNVFGGESGADMHSNEWLRVNTQFESMFDEEISRETELDVIWQQHPRHNHNEQTALLMLVVMVVVVVVWLKCIGSIRQLRNSRRTSNGRGGLFSDGTTVYDEVTTTSADDNEDVHRDIDDENIVHHGISSDDNVYLDNIMQHIGPHSSILEADDDDDDDDSHQRKVGLKIVV